MTTISTVEPARTDSTRPSPDRAASRRPPVGTVAWVMLVLLSVVPLLGALTDLAADARGALPADHMAAFRAATRDGVTAAGQNASGTGHFLHVLEIGYAGHELAFAVLLLAVILGPLRHRRLWAWLVCWTLVAADLAYAATIGKYDPSLLQRSLPAAAATAAALAALAPSVIRRASGNRAGQEVPN